MNRLKISFNWNILSIFLILVLLVAGLTIARPVFLSIDNLLNIVRQVSMVSIIGIGMTFVLISGEIDLSVGSFAALSGIIAAYAMRSGLNIPLSLICALLVTVFGGFVNGFFLTVCRIPSFIVTMGMLNIARGVVLVITNSYPITGLPESFAFIGKGYMGPIPTPVVIMGLCYLVGLFVFKYTKFGRNTYAIGGNKDAARLSGIPVVLNKIEIFMISGFVSGITGIILASRMFSGQPSAGSGMELDAIAACVIGGTSTTGGKGRLWGTLLGALIMGIINNGMNLLGISTNWQLIVKGAIIIIAVGMDQIKKE
jgi:ribose transport system permease protein